MQAAGTGTRRLSQAPTLVNAHFQAQAADGGGAASARDQLQAAASSGNLAVSPFGSHTLPCRSQPDVADSMRERPCCAYCRYAWLTLENMHVQAAMQSQGVTVDSVRVLPADLIVPPTQPSPAGVNTAAIAGGVTAAMVVLAAGAGIALWCFLRRRGTQQDVVEAAEPEYRADPFYCG